MNTIFYVLRTGCQWKAVDRQMMGCSGSSAHEYFQEWVEGKVFFEFWREGLLEYDEVKGIKWEWQATDGAITKAPLGGALPVRTQPIVRRVVPSGRCRPTRRGFLSASQ